MADKNENIKTRLSIDGEAEYKAACKEINSNLKVLNSEMKLVTAEYKDNASSVEALKQKQEVLQKVYDEQAKKVKETEAALERCKAVTGENSEESKKLEIQLNYQRTALVNTNSALKENEKGQQDVAKATSEGVVAQKQYEEHCRKINENIGILSSELNAVTAEYKENEKSVETLSKKQEILAKIFNEQGIKLNETEEALKRCKEENGEYSEESRKLEKELNNQKTAWINARNALKEVEQELTEGTKAQKQYEEACQGIDKNLSLLGAELQEVNAKYKTNENSAKAAAEKQEILKKAYAEQAKKVEETEKAYKSISNEYGKTSKEAKELEEQLHKEKAALYEVDNQINETETSHSKFASTMGALGGAMAKGVAAVGTAAAAIGTAVVAGLGYAVSQADAAKGALNDFTAATGTATDEADQYKQVMENIYNGNYGEGFEDIAAAMTEVRQQAGDLGADELKKMTANALTLRDTFDMDVAESTKAATQLMEKFGVSSDDAYNLIAQGAQNGLNKNGDLLDVINEYSNQYSQAGLSAEDMFNSIKNGADTGVWSIDKMGDAFKEFNIRMNDGTSNEYLESLGLNTDEVVGKFQAGGDSAKEAMSQISTALQNCDDKSLQYTAGVGLMGTMWEDMGADACTSLMDVEGQISKTTDAMGAINEVKYDTFGQAMQGAGRILQTSFIMPIGEQALPIFSQFANELQTGAAAAGGDIGKMAQSFGDAVGNMVNGLAEMLPQITSVAVELATGLVDGLVASAPAIMQAGIDMITGLANGIISAIPTLTNSAAEIITVLIDGIVQLIPSLAEGAVQIIAGLAAGLGQALPQLIPSIIDAVLTIVDTLINNIPMLIDAALQLVSGLADGIVAALPVIIEKLPQIITSIINALVEGIPLILENAADIVIALVDGIIDAIPLLIAAMPQIIVAIVSGLAAGLPKIIAAAGKLVVSIVTKLGELPSQIAGAIAAGVTKIAEWGANMQQKGGTVIMEFVAKIITIVTELPQKIWNSIVGAVTRVATWGLNMQTKAKEVMNTMLTNIVTIVKETPEKIWNCIVGAVTKIATWGLNMLTKAREVMNSMVTGIVNIVTEIPTKIYNSISGAISKVATWGTEVKNKAVEGMRNCVTGIVNAFSNIGSSFADIGGNIVTGIWNGISNGWDWLKNKVKNLANSLLDAAKDALGIESPSKKFRDEVGLFMAQGIGVGFSNEMESVAKDIQNAIPSEFDVGARVNVSKNIDFDNDGKPKPKKGGGAAGGFTVIQHIYANTTDYAKQQKEAARQFKLIARTV